MELLILSSLLILIVSLITIIFLISHKLHNKSGPPLPPGKTGWPVIGESLEFVSPTRNASPETFVRDRMSKHSPKIFKTSLAGEMMAVFCGPSGNKFLFSNENKLVRVWWPFTIERVIISSNNSSMGSAMKKLRTLLPEFLKPEALQKYVHIMDNAARQHLDTQWVCKEQVKAFPLSKQMTFALVCRLFMSLEDPEHVDRFGSYFALVTAGLLSVPVNLTGTAFNRGIKAARQIRREISEIIKMRRGQLASSTTTTTTECQVNSHDLLSHMLLKTNEEGQFFSETEIADMILGILIASHDTTSTVISFVIYYLADHPQVYARVLQEQMEIARCKGPEKTTLNWEDIQRMKYSRNVVNEVMRLQPPSLGAFRQAITDFTYSGFSVPKGWKTLWSVYSTHKDPKCFPNPDEFDPCRFEGNGPPPFSFVPFGGGPRMCPGGEFARLLILVFMHSLVIRFRWEKQSPHEKIIYNPLPILVNGLPIRLLPHTDP